MSLNARFIQGDSIRLSITAKDLTSGGRIDLTGVSIIFRLIKVGDLSGASAFLTSTTAGGITIEPDQSGDKKGDFYVAIPKESSVTLDGTYLGEAQITDTAGRIITLRNEDFSPRQVSSRKTDSEQHLTDDCGIPFYRELAGAIKSLFDLGPVVIILLFSNATSLYGLWYLVKRNSKLSDKMIEVTINANKTTSNLATQFELFRKGL